MALGDEKTKPKGQEKEVEAKEFELPKIEVVAAPGETPTSTVLKKEEIDLGYYQTIQGAFEGQAGVDLTRESLLGRNNHQVSIRGLDESRLQITLNGRSLKATGVMGGYYVDWSMIPLQDIERVEIIRGAQSAAYGDTLGGVINIITGKGSKTPKVSLDASYGSWDTQTYRFSHQYGFGPVLYAFGAGHGKSSGYLRNNYVDRWDVNGTVTVECPWDLSLTLAARYSALDNGMIVENRPYLPFFRPNEPRSDYDYLGGPGLAFKGGAKTWGDNSYVFNQRTELDLSAVQKLWTGQLEFKLFYDQENRHDRFYALDDRNKLIVERGVGCDDTWGWNFKCRQSLDQVPWLGKVPVGFGLEGIYYGYRGYSYEYIDPSYLRVIPTDGGGIKNAQKIQSGYVEATLPLAKFMELYLGLRYDNYVASPNINPVTKLYVYGINKDGLVPKSTLTFRPTDTTEGYISVNYATRYPTQPEFYWFGGGYQPPSRTGSLSPEFGMQYEAGVTQKFPRNSVLRVRGYYYDINQYIRTVFGYRPSRVVYNIPLVKIRGVEVEGEVGLPYNLFAFANYTWQQNSTSPDPLSGDIRELSEYPDHKFNLGLKYKAKNGAEGKAYIRMVSHRYYPEAQVILNKLTGVGLRPMKGFLTLNLEGRYPVVQKGGMKGYLYGGIENLTGEFYEEAAGFPLPTQTIYGGIQLRY
jgi:iron complex outermembrane receptor protein